MMQQHVSQGKCKRAAAAAGVCQSWTTSRLHGNTPVTGLQPLLRPDARGKQAVTPLWPHDTLSVADLDCPAAADQTARHEMRDGGERSHIVEMSWLA